MDDWTNKTHVGDCRELLTQMAADGVRVQTCVTSPPYFGLRDYGTATWEGGAVGCDHRERRGGDGARSTKQTTSAGTQQYRYRQICGKCGARRVDRQIGLEPTATEYVNELVCVFRLVRNLLTPDGTLWLNLGDCFAANGMPGTSHLAKLGQRFTGGGHKHDTVEKPHRRVPEGLKPKDLLGIPWRVAFALQADGWYLRSDIIEEIEFYCPCGCGYLLEERIWRWSQDRELIWKKPNPMPESVRDRPTRVHEYLFLLSKSERYYFDADAIKEPAIYGAPHSPQSISSPYGQGFTRRARTAGVAGRTRPQKAVPNITTGRKELRSNTESRHRTATAGGQSMQANPNGLRNKRSVWTVATTPFRGAHFATFPRKLIEPCIAAGSRPGDIVLDPFSGTGTTRQVAIEFGRRYIGCELNPAYLELERLRTAATGVPR